MNRVRKEIIEITFELIPPKKNQSPISLFAERVV